MTLLYSCLFFVVLIEVNSVTIKCDCHAREAMTDMLDILLQCNRKRRFRKKHF